MKKLILFDIDGTILYPGTLARELLNEVIVQKTGRSPNLQIEDVAGFTDPVIIRTALKKLGINHDNFSAIVNDLLDSYLIRMQLEYPKYPEPSLYNNAIEFVHQCKEKDYRVGLLSGNIREAAKIKLDRFNVWSEFDFGVFGDEAASRGDLLWLARERAWDELSEAYTYDKMILIGDTPNDAKIAYENNVKSVIVCRHSEWKETIKNQHPTWLIESFDDLDTIMKWISG